MEAIAAVCYGDLVRSLYHQAKSYERKAGAADKEREEVGAILTAQMKNAIYVTDCERVGGRITNAFVTEKKACDFALSYPEKIQNELYAAVAAHGRFRMDMPFGEMKKQRKNDRGELPRWRRSILFPSRRPPSLTE